MTLGGIRPLARQRRWTLGKCKARRKRERRAREGSTKRKAKGTQDNSEPKRNRWTYDAYLAGECGYCGKWRHKKAQCWKQKKNQGSKPPAATVQAVVSVNQVYSCGGSEDSFKIFAVSAPIGRNARILVDSGAHEHVCPTNFASATRLGPTKGGMLCDAHMIDAHGTRTLYMRFGLESQSMVAEFRVTNVRVPTSSAWESWSNEATSWRARPIGCNTSKGDRSVTLDVVTHSLWVDAKAYTTIEGARNVDARFVCTNGGWAT